MNQLLLYLVTPCLGLLRNYIKYKHSSTILYETEKFLGT